MEPLLQAVENSALAQGVRFSRWGYTAVNTGHVLGIALLVGAAIPLDLRLLGLWRSVPRAGLVRVLVPTAAAGFAIAAATGAMLFAVRATEYGGVDVLWIKLGLIAAGLASAARLHLRHGRALATAGRRETVLAGAVSMTCWLGALTAGRLIAFVMP